MICGGLPSLSLWRPLCGAGTGSQLGAGEQRAPWEQASSARNLGSGCGFGFGFRLGFGLGFRLDFGFRLGFGLDSALDFDLILAGF